jgi:hypothetical protein
MIANSSQVTARGVVRRVGLFTTLGVALALSACSGGGSGGGGGDPGARALPSGMSCQSLRADLNRMDSQGAQSKVEAASQGKGSAENKAVADKYNMLLNHYLGARCHV